MKLDGKVALVTGGTSGIGHSIVERFMRDGATVVFTGRRAKTGEAIAKTTGASFLEADVGVVADAERTIKTVAERHGRLDILVNNAGGPGPAGRIDDLSLDDFDRVVATHLRGTVAHMKYASPIMRKQKQGSIINISSVAAHLAGYSSSMIYSVVKASVNHLTRCTAMELGEDGVRVNCISPGMIATEMYARAAGADGKAAEAGTEKLKEFMSGVQAVPRPGMPEDIANAAAFLASDESSFVNGADLVIDGGLIGGRRYSVSSTSATAWKALFE
jgi:NAD(P)-dependent dehydrogenase (short-subunit alcohol dehydrogenase family)